MSEITERAMLVNLSVSVWNIEREDRKRAKEIAAKYGTDAKMVSAAKFLVDPDSIKPIESKRGEIRTYHYQHTVPWLDGGQRMIANAGYLDYKRDMSRMFEQFDGLVADFESVYPSLRQTAEYLLNGLYDALEYPTCETLHRKFGHSLRIGPVPSAEDFRVNLDKQDVDSIRQQIQQDLTDASTAATRHVAERIRAVVGNLKTALNGYQPGVPGLKNGGQRAVGAFKNSIVDNIRDLISVIPAINVAGDMDIDRIVADMQSGLVRFDAETLKEYNGTRAKVAANCQTVLDRMAEFGL